MTAAPPSSIFMLHKPKGVVVSRNDERGRKTVYSILPPWAVADGWLPVGRLDLDSRGLLLFTQDGKIVERLTRPGACIKTYEVWVRGIVTPQHVAAMLTGVPSPVGPLKALSVTLGGGASHKTRLSVQLDEGKNRHIRRMFAALQDPERGTPLKVLELKRTHIGNVSLDVASGQWRFLTREECSILGIRE